MKGFGAGRARVIYAVNRTFMNEGVTGLVPTRSLRR
jgi:hypothetical protein